MPESSAQSQRNITLPYNSPTAKQVKSSWLTFPVHIMLSDPGERRDSPAVEQHVFSGEIPAGSFISTYNELEVSSPEFCFLQMSGRLTVVGLIELGYELCGSYSLPIAGDDYIPERGFYKRPPLTSVKKLSAFTSGMPGFSGHKNAVRALRYIVDCSASPMETKLSIFLTLPYKLGGFGFPKPEMNARIEPTKTARRVFSKVFYECDLYWPDHNLAVEYNSNLFHADSTQITEDSKKRNALESMGIKVITVTTQQLYDKEELEKVAILIARRSGKRLVYKNSGFENAHQELRDQLL